MPQTITSRSRLVGILSGLAFFSLHSTARADFTLHFWEDQFPTSKAQLSFTSHTYTTQSNFDHAGSVFRFQELRNYARAQGDLSLSYQWSRSFGFFGRASLAYINQDSDSISGMNYGLADQSAGLSWRLIGTRPQSDFILDFQAQVDFPGYINKNSLSSSKPYLGDESIDITSGVFSHWSLTENSHLKLSATLGAGYTYRTAGYSSALPFSVLLKLHPQNHGFLSELGVSGFFSLRTDSSSTSGSVHSSLPLGGTYVVGGQNASLLNLMARLGYRFSPRAQVLAFFTPSLWGQNAPNGILAGLTLQFRLGETVLSRNEQIEEDRQDDPPAPEDTLGARFQTYSMEATILKINSRLNLVKINKGSQDGIKVNDVFDIFNAKMTEKAKEIIAQARVTHIKAEEAALEIVEYYQDTPVEEGLIVRRLIP
ncbi:MAG: hypothetical protein ACO3A2_05325 [Bdellovibrionia bacterium]